MRAAEETLSVKLLEGTAAARTASERCTFFQTLYFGAWGKGVYAQFVRAQQYVAYLGEVHAVYAALEQALAIQPPHCLSHALGLAPLWRSRAIAADVAFFGGDLDVLGARRTHATTLYVERLREVGNEAPRLLIAHAYARLSQDALRGRALAEQIACAFDLDGEAGTRLFRCNGEAGLWRTLREALDALPTSEQLEEELVMEATLAFRLQRMIGDELWREVLRSPEARRALRGERGRTFLQPSAPRA